MILSDPKNSRSIAQYMGLDQWSGSSLVTSCPTASSYALPSTGGWFHYVMVYALLECTVFFLI